MGLGRALASPFVDSYKAYASPYHGMVRPSIAGAVVGAGAGAVMGGMIPNGMDPLQSAAVGAGIGSLALPAVGAFGALGVKAFQNPDVFMKAGAGIGKGIGAVGRGIGAGAKAAGMPQFGKELLKQNPIARHGNMVGRALGGVLKYTPEKSYFDEAKGKVVTKRAKMGLSKGGLVAGSAIGLGVMAKGLLNDVYEGRSGTPTGVTRATPSYLDNAGASGDLVFAMHQNRRG